MHRVLALALVLSLAADAAGQSPLPVGALRRIGAGRFEHPHPVRGLAFAPDGKSFVADAGDSLYGWETATGRPLFRVPLVFAKAKDESFTLLGPAGGKVLGGAFRTPTGSVSLVDIHPTTGVTAPRPGKVPTLPQTARVAFAPGGQFVALVGPTGEAVKVRIHDLSGGRPPVDLPPLDDTAEVSLAFTPTGTAVAVAAGTDAVRVYACASGGLVRDLKFDGPVHVGPFSPDGEKIVIYAKTKTDRWAAQLRDAATGKPHGMVLEDLSARPEAKFLVAGRLAVKAADGPWRVHDAVDGTVLYALLPACSTIETSPDGKTLAAAVGTAVELLDAATGKPAVTAGPAAAVSRLRWTRDNKLLGLGLDGRVMTWDPKTGAELGRGGVIPDAGRLDLALVGMNWDGTRLAYLAGADEQRIHLYDLKTETRVSSFDAGIPFPYARFTPTDMIVPKGNTLAVCDPVTGKEKFTVPAAADSFRSYDLSRDGKYLAVGGPVQDPNDVVPQALLVYDTATRNVCYTLIPDDPRMTACGFSADCRTLFSAGSEGGLIAWDLATGKRRWAEKVIPAGPTVGCMTMPDGRGVVVTSDDQILRVVEAATGRVRIAFRGHQQRVSSFDVSKDSRYLVSASADVPIYVWDVRGEAGADGPPPDADTLARYWAELRKPDAGVALFAVRAFSRHPEVTLPFLEARLKAVPAPDAGRLAKWVADLDAPAFAARETASKELRALGELAAPAVAAELARTKSPEVRERATAVLAGLRPTPDDVRTVRAIESLEWAGTPGAKKLLAMLAAGAAGATATRDATAALARLGP